MQAAFSQKAGYLTDPYRLFYLKGIPQKEIPFHYHDFHKLLFLLDGQIQYHLEGRTLSLLPGDILLIGAGQLHRPSFEGSLSYERMILYLSPGDFAGLLRQERTSSYIQKQEKTSQEKTSFPDLLDCFTEGNQSSGNLLRPAGPDAQVFQALAKELIREQKRPDDYAVLYERLKVTELMITVNRSLKNTDPVLTEEACPHPTISRCMDYVSQHLSEETLCIEDIAKAVFLSKSYLMHLFKEQTGYSLGDYIAKKRLFLANQLLQAGHSVTEACYQSGYRNYSAFYYAYKKRYHVSPAGETKGVQNIHNE